MLALTTVRCLDNGLVSRLFDEASSFIPFREAGRGHAKRSKLHNPNSVEQRRSKPVKPHHSKSSLLF